MLTAKNYLNIICIIISIVLTAYITSITYQLKISKIEKKYLNEKNAVLVKQDELNKLNIKLNNQLKQKEKEYYDTYSKIQEENENLRNDVATSARKLRIKVTNCNAATENSASSLDDGRNTTADIDARDAAAIISITKKADKYKSQLDALQSYIKDYNLNIDKLNQEK